MPKKRLIKYNTFTPWIFEIDEKQNGGWLIRTSVLEKIIIENTTQSLSSLFDLSAGSFKL